MRAARRVALSDLDENERARLLAADVSAALAFLDERGHPRIVPCWFLWEDGAFHVTSVADKFHVRCLRRDPRASICVEVERVTAGRVRANRQVKAVGTVDVLADPDGTWTRRVREKYLRAAALEDVAAARRDRVVLRLVPERLSAHGGGIEMVDPA